MKLEKLKYRPKEKDSRIYDEVERDLFSKALKANDGKLTHVAQVLGINIITARKRASRLGLWPWKG